MLQHNPEEDDSVMVVQRLGNNISAMAAVPAAIYSFLKNLNTGFENTLYYVIGLGGDTDTIGSMCLSICGAYYGRGNIPNRWIEVSEAKDEMIGYADSFLSMHGPIESSDTCTARSREADSNTSRASESIDYSYGNRGSPIAQTESIDAPKSIPTESVDSSIP